jgi:hypothetical protein
MADLQTEFMLLHDISENRAFLNSDKLLESRLARYDYV